MAKNLSKMPFSNFKNQGFERPEQLRIGGCLFQNEHMGQFHEEEFLKINRIFTLNFWTKIEDECESPNAANVWKTK